MKKEIGKVISAILCIAAIAAIFAGKASGTVADNVALNKTVTLHGGTFFTGGWGGGLVVSEDTVVDGNFFPRGTQWDQGPVWWDCHDSIDRYIIIHLEGVYEIESFVVQADDNDAYLLYYRDMATDNWEIAWNVPNYDVYPDPSNWGMQTRPNPDDDTERYVLPSTIVTDALMFKGDMVDGNGWFAVSEIQAYGKEVVGGLPEFGLAVSTITSVSAILYMLVRRRLNNRKE